MNILKAFCLAFSLFFSSYLLSEEVANEVANAEPLALFSAQKTPPENPSKESPQEGYTINYNTVSIIEYIRFASKICNINFLFNEEDLDFTVTVVSDAPITHQNVMATLLQTLRIHGLELLEQDNSLVIHKASDVKQIATLVTETGQEKNAPIVTRIFRLVYLKPDSLAAIIRPMISGTSILESSPETRQLILTDITANVDKVAALIEIIDSPSNPLEMKTYQPLHNSPDSLVELASQIMTPLSQGSPFTLVAQPLANSVYIVSTPDLVNKALAALKSLDVPPKQELIVQRKLKGENIFVYKALNRPSNEIVKGLMDIADNLKKTGIPEGDLIDTIDSARSVRETNSILFVGSKDSIAKLQEFLTTLDVVGKEGAIRNSFFVYKPQNRSAAEIEQALREMAGNLKGTKGADESFIDMLLSAKINNATNTLVFSGDQSHFAQIKDLLTTIDSPSGKKAPQVAVKNSFFLYKLQHASFHDLQASLQSFAKNLNKSNVNDEGVVQAIDDMKHISETNSILFSGPDTALKRLQELAPMFDSGIVTLPVSNQFYIYKPKFQRGDQLSTSIKEVAVDLKSDTFTDPAFIRTLESMKYIKATNSLLFTGDDASIKRLDSLIATLDIPAMEKPTEKSFFLYTVQFATKERTETYLNQLAHNLDRKSEAPLIDAIRSMKWIDASHSFMFQGTDPAISRLKDILQTFDKAGPQAPLKNFFLYTLQSATQQKANQYLDDLAESMSKQGGESQDLVDALRTRKWISDSNSFLFNGNEASLARIKDILQNFDKANPQRPPKNFFLYPLQYAAEAKTDQYLEQVASNLSKQGGGSQDLIHAIQSRKWLADSHAFMFSGTEDDLNQIKDILKTFDVPEAQASKTGYFLYKLQGATVDTIEEDLDTLAKNFKSTGMKDSSVLHVIDNIRYVKETNSLLLTGDPAAIEEVKTMIAEYDHPSVSKEPVSSDFFMYKPQHRPAAEIEKSLQDVAENLKKANLADPSLLKTIGSVKYVATTNSLIFTGNTDTLQKIQSLLKDIDIPPQAHAPIQHVGKTTFLLYKLKNAGGTQIVTSIKTMESDLKKSGNADKDFIAALSTMKYVKETNSLLFTGTEEGLKKVQTLVETFDVASLAAPGPQPVEKPVAPTSTNFYLYKPQSVPGPDLEKLMQDFAENLKLSGLSDPDLFNAIVSMRWVEKTQSLIFAGTPKSLDQLKELLKEFDIPANAPGGGKQPSLEPTISAVDNTSFLVYKLQFHKGDEIQGALRQIAKDLMTSNAPINQNLLNAINSIQWLDITNSLLISGDQETLTRLKELIKNLDIPLKQVFIEILVIETSLTNALNFGLEWGGNYKFNDKFGVGTYNTAPPANIQAPFPDTFVTNLGKLTPPTPPTPIGNIPPVTGFDLGVIGEVIKHNGSTFLTLGSLLSALQNDTETTIVNTPKILAQDGRTSTFFSGSNIPFTGSFVNNTQSGATVQTSNLEYRDIGLNLTITPVLGNSDIVTLDINLDREQTATDITQTQLNFNAQTANGIITSKTTMQTTVHVPDRNFLILSGFVNNSNTKQKAGIPCLGGLPMIGAAFSQANDTISNQNIVIFLRPFILNSIDDMRRVTSEQEDFFRDQTGTPFLEHNYEECVELIKTIDDE